MMSHLQELNVVGVAQSNTSINRATANQTQNKERKISQQPASSTRSVDRSFDLTREQSNPLVENLKSQITNTSESLSKTARKSVNSQKFKRQLQTYTLTCEEILGLGIVRGQRVKDKTVVIYNSEGQSEIIETFSVYILINSAASFGAFAPAEFIQDLPKYIKDKFLKVLLAFEFDEYDQTKVAAIQDLKTACRKPGRNTCLSFPRKQMLTEKSSKTTVTKH